MSAPLVDILLPTWNGERFLRAQLDSLLAQSFTQWRLLVRDDGSTDGTVSLVEEYAKRDPRVQLLATGGARLGAAGNVSALLAASTARFAMLCDQDDVWRADKVAVTIERLLSAESKFGEQTPILVHADLEVVTEDLARIAPSFWAFRSLDAEHGVTFGRLLVRNVAVGCTMGLNTALRALVVPIPSAAYMHDWWIALVAASFGRVERIDRPLLSYRQHGDNSIGAGVSLGADLLRVAREPQRLGRYYTKTKAQAAAFLDRFAARMPPGDRIAAEIYASGRRSVLRPVRLLRAGVRDSSLLRNVALLALG